MFKKIIVLSGLLATFLLVGCASPSSNISHASNMSGNSGVELAWIKADVNLADCQSIVVSKFNVGKIETGDDVDSAALTTQLQNEMTSELAKRRIFKKVSGKIAGIDKNKPYLLVEGKITEIDPGSQTARFLCPGFGMPHIQIETKVKNGKTSELLIETCDKRTYGWGGLIGGTRTGQDILIGRISAFAEDFADLLENEKKNK